MSLLLVPHEVGLIGRAVGRSARRNPDIDPTAPSVGWRSLPHWPRHADGAWDADAPPAGRSIRFPATRHRRPAAAAATDSSCGSTAGVVSDAVATTLPERLLQPRRAPFTIMLVVLR
jgi:hypothetical protein